MGIDSPEEPMVTDRRGIVLISFPQSIAEPSNHKPVLYIGSIMFYPFLLFISGFPRSLAADFDVVGGRSFCNSAGTLAPVKSEI